MLLEFVRRTAGRDEMNLVEVETAIGGTSDREMSGMNGIKRTTKECDASGLMLCRGAVSLRCGQSFSPEETRLNSLTKRERQVARLLLPRFLRLPKY